MGPDRIGTGRRVRWLLAAAALALPAALTADVVVLKDGKHVAGDEVTDEGARSGTANPPATKGVATWGRPGSNREPRDYESPALPLSYGPAWHGEASRKRASLLSPDLLQEPAREDDRELPSLLFTGVH